MKQLLVFALLVFSFNFGKANSITIDFVNPQVNQLLDSSVLIEVTVLSTYEISTVIADINGNQATLVFDNGSGKYSGYITITGSPQGIPLLLTVTATDIFNTPQSGSVNILYVKPPRIEVNYPIQWTNAYPSLHVKANCVSIDTCTLTIKIEFQYNSQIVFLNNFTDSVDTIVSFQPIVPGYAMVLFTAKDKWNQESSIIKWILFDNNYYLSEKYSGPNRIFDFNYDKVLEVASDDLDLSRGQGTLVDVNTHTSTTMQGSYLDNESLSFVTPYGAVYGQNLNIKCFDWNNNSLYMMGPSGLTPFNTVRTSGQYATWATNVAPNETQLYLRNLATRNDMLIATIYEYIIHNDVATNGSVAYWGADYNIYWFKNNVTIPVSTTNGGNEFNDEPLTDGNNVAYLKHNAAYDFFLCMHNGSTSTQLSSIGNFSGVDFPKPGINYQVKNKFIAYSKLGTSGQLQVWLRDSTGVQSQATFFNTTSTIEWLNEKGDIMFNNDGKRYLVEHGSILPKALGSAMGKVYYRDSSWYVVEGRHLYRLLVHASVSVANGNWNDPATWENGIVPASNADVIVLSNVTVTANASCNTLNIHLPGSVTVSPGVTLTILH